MSAPNVRPAPAPVQVPLSGQQELTAGRISLRRNGDGDERDCELFQHNPAIKAVAAASLVAMASTANGHTPSLRLDQTKRYRLFQLDGSKALPHEERVGIALENELGADVHIAGERPVFAALAVTHPGKVRAFAAELAALTGADVVSSTAQEQLASLMVAISNLGLHAAEDVRDDGQINRDHTARVQAVVEAARPFMVGHALPFYRRATDAKEQA